MNSRVDRYYDKNVEVVGSRTKRNDQLYKEISKEKLENFDVKSNATVIGNNRNNIDVEKIKSILDMHYNDAPKRRSIQIETPKEEKKPVYQTKEYDINVILNKAKEEKVDNYNEIRAKRLHDTQFDILQKLDIKREDFIEDYDGDSAIDIKKSDTAAQKLQDLINTITMNEQDFKQNQQEKQENADPLDMFEDLKGSENTVTLEGLQEKTEQMIKTMSTTTSMDSSFFTKKDKIKENDFEDFKDIEESSSGTFVKILIALLVVIFIIGVVILVKTFIA